MALRKVRLQSWDPEADLRLYELDVGEDGPPLEFEHGGRRFRFFATEDPAGTLVYTDLTPKP